jgi:hypothetical protein
LYGGINEFNKGLKPRLNLVKDERNGLSADSNILNRWKNYVCQLLNAQGVCELRLVEVYTSEPSVAELGPFEVQIANES